MPLDGEPPPFHPMAYYPPAQGWIAAGPSSKYGQGAEGKGYGPPMSPRGGWVSSKAFPPKQPRIRFYPIKFSKCNFFGVGVCNGDFLNLTQIEDPDPLSSVATSPCPRQRLGGRAGREAPPPLLLPAHL